MNFKILWEHLKDPEYIHVLINPLPVFGLLIAVLALALTLFLRTQHLTVAALIMVFICSISAWPTYHYGQAGYDRVKSIADGGEPAMTEEEPKKLRASQSQTTRCRGRKSNSGVFTHQLTG